MPPEDMVVAAKTAINDWNVHIQPTLTKEELAGIRKFVFWWKGVYLKAGYKTICQWIMYELSKDL